jgi:hypothetical protein
LHVGLLAVAVYLKANTNTNPAEKKTPHARGQGQLSSAGHCNKK